MKHTKIFFALLVLAGAVLAFGCNQANSNGGSSGGNGGGFTMNEKQKAAYDAVIAYVKLQATAYEIPANIVEEQLTSTNKEFASLKFKVVDTQKGKPIAKGTDENALKARFKPEAL